MIEAICKHNNLPLPEREYRFAPPRRWRVDWAWPKYKLALESEGGVWSRGRHVRGRGFLGDMQKYNNLTLFGWALLRVTPQMIESGEAADMIKLWFNRYGKKRLENAI